VRVGRRKLSQSRRKRALFRHPGPRNPSRVPPKRSDSRSLNKVRVAATAERQYGRITWAQLRQLGVAQATVNDWVNSGYLFPLMCKEVILRKHGLTVVRYDYDQTLRTPRIVRDDLLRQMTANPPKP
jgi:hypothetical protein